MKTFFAAFLFALVGLVSLFAFAEEASNKIPAEMPVNIPSALDNGHFRLFVPSLSAAVLGGRAHGNNLVLGSIEFGFFTQKKDWSHFGFYPSATIACGTTGDFGRWVIGFNLSTWWRTLDNRVKGGFGLGYLQISRITLKKEVIGASLPIGMNIRPSENSGWFISLRVTPALVFDQRGNPEFVVFGGAGVGFEW